MKVFFVCLFSIVNTHSDLRLIYGIGRRFLPTLHKISVSFSMSQHVNNIYPSILLFQPEFYHFRSVATDRFVSMNNFNWAPDNSSTWEGRRTTEPYSISSSWSWEDSTSKLPQVVQIPGDHTSEKHYCVMAAQHEVLHWSAQLLWQHSQLLTQRH